MIYTVSFNPAWDYVLRVDELKMGMTNRTSEESVTFGGKGINVSAVLNELGVESVALGFTAGFLGEALKKEIESKGIKCDFVHLEKGMTRINIKLKSEDETEINASGPEIDDDALNRLLSKLDRFVSGDILVLAGSVPSGVSVDIYEKILERLKYKEVLIVVDASDELLLSSLKYRPFLIKPNIYELRDIFKHKIETDLEITEAAKSLKELGAKNVLVSMAEDGALLIDEHGKLHRINAAKGEVVNSVGAGDSMVAGFLAGYLKTKDYDCALKLATAAGGATAFSKTLANKKLIDDVLKTL